MFHLVSEIPVGERQSKEHRDVSCTKQLRLRIASELFGCYVSAGCVRYKISQDSG